jgi:hypothetical protein
VCQPRRIAAVGLATRVAAELGDPSGVGGLCGYSVRLDSKVSDATRLVFVTTGVLLRRLMSDPELTGECETPCAIRAREPLAERLPDLYLALQLGCGMQKGASSCICIAIGWGGGPFGQDPDIGVGGL